MIVSVSYEFKDLNIKISQTGLSYVCLRSCAVMALKIPVHKLTILNHINIYMILQNLL